MCLGIPGKVVEIRDDGPLRMARVDFGGVRQEACLAYVPDVALGDYVIVHVGFAISRLDEDEALRTLEMLHAIDELVLEQELATMGPGDAAPRVVDAGAAPAEAAAAPTAGAAPAAEPAAVRGPSA
jgi:hydrogenase expression/formation protein HypC